MSDDGLRGSWKGPEPSDDEMENEHQELEAAGWEHIEDFVGKHLWKNPDSGHIYPQDSAITIVRGENLKDYGEEEPL